MCVKNRDRSLALEGIIAAQKRLLVGHPLLPVLSAKQASLEAGIGGEERVAEIFRRHPFSFEHHIFHDLSPTSDSQMDTYFMTPYFGIVFEVKNIAGVLEFKDNPPQLIRTRENGQKDGFESPVVQLERNREMMGTLLRRHNINIPIFGAVVLAYPKQIVAVSPAKTTILFPNLIPTYIRSIPQQAKKLDLDTFNWLSSELLNRHHRYIPKPVCERYNIPVGDFQPGVICKACGRIGMVKTPRTWTCLLCGAVDHTAGQRTLLEWFLLNKRSITNRECREFLGIDNIHMATRILQSSNMQIEGTFKNRSYIMDLSKLK